MNHRRRVVVALGIVLALGAVFSSRETEGKSTSLDRADIEEKGLARATFAGGCFWCMEPPFDKIDGVHATISGYIGGEKDNPTYKEVSAGITGHTEAVQIVYDPKVVDYQSLVAVASLVAIASHQSLMVGLHLSEVMVVASHSAFSNYYRW